MELTPKELVIYGMVQGYGKLGVSLVTINKVVFHNRKDLTEVATLKLKQMGIIEEKPGGFLVWTGKYLE